MFIFLIPGYVTVEGLFPRGRQTGRNRTLRIECWTESGTGAIGGLNARLHGVGNYTYTHCHFVDCPHGRTVGVKALGCKNVVAFIHVAAGFWDMCSDDAYCVDIGK